MKNCDLGSLIATDKITIFAATLGVFRQMLSQAKLNNTIKLRHGLSAGDKFSVLLIPHSNLQQAVRFLKHMVWPNVTHLSLLARITLVIRT